MSVLAAFFNKSTLVAKSIAGAGSPFTALARSISGCGQDVFGYDSGKYRPRFHPITRLRRGMTKNRPKVFGAKAFLDKPVQEWEDWDGFGRYKYRHHDYPTNWTLRDVQKRRIFEKHAEERLRINAIRKADILPKELIRLADQDIHKVPRDSSITRINRRCSVTGRGRGIFHQFRVSRFVFRAEADYNKVSGAERAKWERGIDIDP